MANRNLVTITAAETFDGKEFTITNRKGRQVRLSSEENRVTWEDTYEIIRMVYGLKLSSDNRDFFPDCEYEGYQDEDEDYTCDDPGNLDCIAELTFEGQDGKYLYKVTEIDWRRDMDTVSRQVLLTLDRIKEAVDSLKEDQRRQSKLMWAVSMG
jgi:hypothetical protein